MTGRELIVYILQHGLEDEPVIKDNQIAGYISIEDFAKHGIVGIETVKTWIKLGMLDSVQIGNTIFVPIDSALSCSYVVEIGGDRR